MELVDSMAYRKAAAARIEDILDTEIEEGRQRKVALEHILAAALQDMEIEASLDIVVAPACPRLVLDHKLAAEPLAVMELVVA
jgi:diphthamide synthase subunit DPH2